MNTLTYIVGYFFFPKLLRNHRVKELQARRNWLAVAFALLLVGGVVMTLLLVYDIPTRSPVMIKPLGS